MTTVVPRGLARDAVATLAQRADTLFAVSLNRAALLTFPAGEIERRVRLHVIRNHAVEHALSALPALLSPWRLDIGLTFGDYDDSLAVGELPAHDAILIWLDFTRFQLRVDSNEFCVWFETRLAALRFLTDATILVVGPVIEEDRSTETVGLRMAVERISGIELLTTDEAVAVVGVAHVYDRRAAQFSGTPFSSRFLLEIARRLAASPLPRAFGFGLKAIVCDLDGTLYDGVLGEDGVEHVVLTPARRQIQERLLVLRRQGLLLAVLSRNTPSDVEHLFAVRRDFPLAWDDFAFVEASWDSKRIGFGRIVDQLRVGADTVLFLDDNLGELIDVAQEWPQAQMLPANDPEATLRALHFFPGIEGFRVETPREVAQRTADLRANVERAKMSAHQSDEAYLRALAMRIEFHLDDPVLCGRMVELSSKTNQFNLALARVPLARVVELAAAADGFALAVSLRDRLSDSGVVAFWCGRVEGSQLVTEDLVISCRSLGRRIEGILLTAAFRFVAERHAASAIVLPWREGPRNQPALGWLAQTIGAKPEISPVVISLPALPETARWIAFHYSTYAN